VEARQFLSCIARLAQRGQRFGAAHIIDILRGARSERLLARGHDSLSVYGIGKQRRVEEWRTLARALLHQGLIEETQDGYPVLSLNAQSWPVLREERPVHIAQAAKTGRVRKSTAASATAASATTASATTASATAASATAASATAASATTASAAAAGAAVPDSTVLFEHLRALRKQLADQHGLPPYVIFHDSTLREMAERRPSTLDQFATLRGVGQGKLARYGERFIAALREHSTPGA
jgi:ATP-dependent DNA helicase RecQ